MAPQFGLGLPPSLTHTAHTNPLIPRRYHEGHKLHVKEQKKQKKINPAREDEDR